MSADRNLLLGLIALQLDLLDRDQLIEGMLDWLRDKSRPLGQILQERNVLSGDDGAALERLVDRHVLRHGGQVQHSLAAVPVEPSVREELERMADEELRTCLTHAPAPPTTPHTSGEGTPRPPLGAETNRFHRLRLHARGGLGEVFVAVDEQLGREVALKEIQDRHADQPDCQARFLREAEITGKLEHPGIVPVYGLGTRDDGRPYYAMRFVQGQSLHEAIQGFHKCGGVRPNDPTQQLALRGLLGRFVAMCNTIAYAHSRGVLHRDIKPGNILLGEYGETLVVDWGLGRVLDESEETSTRPFQPVAVTTETTPTEIGQVLGTPAFMPPEQARGEVDRVGPRRDVWALGATLYALLTGKAPYHGPDVLGQARKGEIVAPRRIQPHTPPALDAVCLRALAMQPEDRYPSATSLAAEIERWLADEPVEARREPLTERTRRWARRHRTLVTSAGLALLLIAVGLGVGLWAVRQEQSRTLGALTQARDNLTRAEAAEDVAQGNLTLARRAVNECYEVARTHPLLGDPAMRQVQRDLLARALPFYQQFQAKKPNDSQGAMDLADHHYRVGTILAFLGRSGEALAVFDQAKELTLTAIEKDPDKPRYRWFLSHLETNRGVALKQLGRWPEAMAALRRAQDQRTQLAVTQPLDHMAAHELANSQLNIAAILQELGRLEEALASYEKASGSLRKLIAAHPNFPEHTNELGVLNNNLGALYGSLKRPQQAVESYREACRLHRRLVTDHPRNLDFQRQLARSTSGLGSSLERLGKNEDALAAFRESRNLYQSLVENHPDLPDHQNELINTLSRIGEIQHDTGRHREALDTLLQACTLGHRLLVEHPNIPDYSYRTTFAWRRLARVMEALGRTEEEILATEQVRDIAFRLTAAHPDQNSYRRVLAANLYSLGRQLSAKGRTSLAAHAYRQAYREHGELMNREPDRPEHQASRARAAINLGIQTEMQGQPLEAMALYREGRGLLSRLIAVQPDEREHLQDLSGSYTNEGSVWTRANQFGQALRCHERARDILIRFFAAHPVTASHRLRMVHVHREIGLTLESLGRREDALTAYTRSRDFAEQMLTLHPEDESVLSYLNLTLQAMDRLLHASGRRAEAAVAYRRTRDVLTGALRKNPKSRELRRQLGGTLTNLGILLAEQGKTEEARASTDRAVQLWEQLAAAEPTQIEAARQLAGTLGNLARFLHQLGRPGESLEANRKAHAAWAKLAKAHPGVAEYRYYQAVGCDAIAYLLGEMGKHDEVLTTLAEARSLLIRLIAEHPGSVQYLVTLARVHNREGYAQKAIGRVDDARSAFERSRDVYLLANVTAPSPAIRDSLASAQETLGSILVEQMRSAEAMHAYQQAVALREALVRENPTLPSQVDQLARLSSQYGHVLDVLGNGPEACTQFTRAVTLWRGLHEKGWKSPTLEAGAFQSAYHLASALERRGLHREAVAALDDALRFSSPALRVTTRVQRALAMLKAGDRIRARTEAWELTRLPSFTSVQCFALAGLHARLAGSLSVDPAVPLPVREKQAEQHARRAMDFLEAASGAGLFRDQKVRRFLDRTDDLTYLRNRADFRAFRAGLDRPIP